MDSLEQKINHAQLRQQLSDLVGHLNNAIDCIGNMWLILEGRTDECIRHREMLLDESGRVTFEEE